MEITESDITLTGASMAQDQQSIDPLHTYTFDNVMRATGADDNFNFTTEEAELAEKFISRIGSVERALALFEYVQQKDVEYADIVKQTSDMIGSISAAMPDDDFASLEMQDYMNASTNPGANGSHHSY